MSKKKPQDESARGAAHVLIFVSTKPPHPVLRREKCECLLGKDHSQYESPN